MIALAAMWVKLEEDKTLVENAPLLQLIVPSKQFCTGALILSIPTFSPVPFRYTKDEKIITTKSSKDNERMFFFIR